MSDTHFLKWRIIYNVCLLKYLFIIGLFKILFPQLPQPQCFIPVTQHALCKLGVFVNSQRHFPTHDTLRPSGAPGRGPHIAILRNEDCEYNNPTVRAFPASSSLSSSSSSDSGGKGKSPAVGVVWWTGEGATPSAAHGTAAILRPSEIFEAVARRSTAAPDGTKKTRSRRTEGERAYRLDASDPCSSNHGPRGMLN